MKIGGVELSWQHPSIEEIDLSEPPAFGGYDAILIDLDRAFSKIADMLLGPNVGSDPYGRTVTSPELARQLSIILQQIREQLRELCSVGGIVVGLMSNPSAVAYDATDPYYRNISRAMGNSQNLAYVQSIDLLFGPYYVPNARDWRYQFLHAHGDSVVPITDSIWGQYLMEDVEFHIVIQQLPVASRFRPIATEKFRDRASNRVIAVAEQIDDGQIALLPTPRSEAAKEKLLVCVKTALTGPQLPDWVTTITVPGTKELEQQIMEAYKQIQEANADIEELHKWRQLLYETGNTLEERVGEAFGLLGIPYDQPTQPDNPDWIITLAGEDIVVEVTGVDGIVGKRKLEQLNGWVRRYRAKGLLIANPFRQQEPADRDGRPLDELIAPQGIEIAAREGLAIMCTSQIFEMVMLCLEDRQEEAQAQFGGIIGQDFQLGANGRWQRT